ncbi:MAG: hypothetical protein JKY86_01180 [Gammaproteobacteria bacterium]|nr:hypothetical protein [Gammaproteobacteria bacterium]
MANAGELISTSGLLTLEDRFESFHVGKVFEAPGRTFVDDLFPNSDVENVFASEATSDKPFRRVFEGKAVRTSMRIGGNPIW